MHIIKISKKYPDLIKWIIGGPNIINQSFSIIKEFYITRIYGDFSCDTFFDLNIIRNEMKLVKKIDCDNSCHFEIWTK